VQEGLNSQVNSVATGLAVIQSNISDTTSALGQVKQDLGKNSSFLSVIAYVVFLVIAVSIAVISTYYLTHKRKMEQQFYAELTPHIRTYLTQQIKLGKKFSQIRDELSQQKWKDEEIRWAYRETLRQNYLSYLDKSNGKVSFLQQLEARLHYNDVFKVMAILTVSIILVVGLTFMINGNTGKAFFANDAEQFNAQVNELLNQNIMNNSFYSLIGSVNLCVQVDDNLNTASFRMVKTSRGQLLQKAVLPCDHESNKYDFAVKFASFNQFENTLKSMNCDSLRKARAIVLPSRFILPGYRLNSERDASGYCTVLKLCLSDSELRGIGVKC
jgi:cell shape-determining protein MreD